MTKRKTLTRETAPKNYTRIDNELIRDARLSCDEVGALVRVFSHDDQFGWNLKYLQQLFGCGRDATRAMLTRFEQLGYLERTPKRTPTGLRGWDWSWYAPARPDLAKKASRPPESQGVTKPKKEEEIFFRAGSLAKPLQISRLKKSCPPESQSVTNDSSTPETQEDTNKVNGSKSDVNENGSTQVTGQIGVSPDPLTVLTPWISGALIKVKENLFSFLKQEDIKNWVERTWSLLPKNITPDSAMKFAAEAPAAKLVLCLSENEDWVWDTTSALLFTRACAEGDVSVPSLLQLLALKKHGFVAFKKDLQSAVEGLKALHSQEREIILTLQEGVAEKLALSSKEYVNGKVEEILEENDKRLTLEQDAAKVKCEGKGNAQDTLKINGDCPVCPIFMAEEWFERKFKDHEKYREMFKEKFLEELSNSWRLREFVRKFSPERILAIWGLKVGEIEDAANGHVQSLLVDKLLLRA